MNETQMKRIAKVLEQLPEQMEDQELEATICAIAAGYLGNEQVADYLQYLSDKVRVIYTFMMADAEEETKH